MNKKTIRDIDVKGKRCLVRVDFNVPMKDGIITDETRIQGAIPTIKYLIENDARVILCSHLGRPKGEFNLKYSLEPVAKRLSEIFPGKVEFVKDCIGKEAEEKSNNLKNGNIILLENLRFYKEEENNDESFCKKLASLAEIYVNDAFGTAHRAHASTAGVVQYGFIKTAVSGFLLQKEIEMLGNSINTPIRPLVAILGGAKVSDKIGVISNLIKKCDSIIIGGGMAYTFFKAQGKNIGSSLCENDKIELAKQLLETAKQNNVNLILPIDNIVADKFDNEANTKIVDNDVPDGYMGLDIGPKSIDLFTKTIIEAKTVVWNGPMGVFEMPNFAKGTEAIAKALTMADNATTIVGGGDSVAAITQLGYANKVSHVSTGGGASLELLEGRILPGVDCLNDK